MQKQKQIFPVLIIILIVFSITPVKATNFSDPVDDVWSQVDNSKGDYADSIDLTSVWVYGSEIIVKCNGSITANETESKSYLVLFNEDGDSSNWEAAIIIKYLGIDLPWTVFWIVGEVFGSQEGDWNVDYAGAHHLLSGNQLTLVFLEYENITFADILVISSLRDGANNTFYDWVPDSYDFSITIESLPELSPVFMIPGEKPPDNKTTTTSTTSTTSTTGIVTTSRESSPFFTPGFTAFALILMVPVLFILRRKYH